MSPYRESVTPPEVRYRTHAFVRWCAVAVACSAFVACMIGSIGFVCTRPHATEPCHDKVTRMSAVYSTSCDNGGRLEVEGDNAFCRCPTPAASEAAR